MGDSRIHELLLRDVAKDDLDHVLGLCDALCTHAKEDAQMVLEWQDLLQNLQKSFRVPMQKV